MKKDRRAAGLFVLQGKILRGWEASLVRTAQSYQKIGKDVWWSSQKGVVMKTRSAETFDYEAHNWWWRDFYRRPKGVWVWTDVILSCETLQTSYCQCNQRTVKSIWWCEPCSILWVATSDKVCTQSKKFGFKLEPTMDGSKNGEIICFGDND